MRYYTLCHFTPSIRGYRKNYVKVWNRAPDAFLFHDTENSLEIEDVRKPLFILSELHVLNDPTAEAATSSVALAARVDSKTIAVTFSLRGFPSPIKLYKDGRSRFNGELHEWLSASGLSGWYIESVKDNSIPATPIDFSSFFDDCQQLPRLMGECPCPLLSEGQCLNTLVWPKLPAAFRQPAVHNSLFELTNKDVSKRRYSNLAGFQYVSSAKTTPTDFNQGMRPWDNHDFTLVQDRQNELSARGKVRHIREKSRKERCSSCVFANRQYSYKQGVLKITDCGYVNSCNHGATEEQTRTALLGWYQHSLFASNDGFTKEQRDWLVRKAGDTVNVKALYPTRKTKTIYGGFRIRYSKITYQLSAAAGDLTRSIEFESFSDLKQCLASSDNPIPDDLSATEPLTDDQATAYAVVCFRHSYRQRYGQDHPVRLIKLETPEYVYMETAADRYIVARESIKIDDLKRLVYLHPSYTYPSVYSSYLNHAPPASTIHLPVITE